MLSNIWIHALVCTEDPSLVSATLRRALLDASEVVVGVSDEPCGPAEDTWQVIGHAQVLREPAPEHLCHTQWRWLWRVQDGFARAMPEALVLLHVRLDAYDASWCPEDYFDEDFDDVE